MEKELPVLRGSYGALVLTFESWEGLTGPNVLQHGVENCACHIPRIRLVGSVHTCLTKHLDEIWIAFRKRDDSFDNVSVEVKRVPKESVRFVEDLGRLRGRHRPDVQR